MPQFGSWGRAAAPYGFFGGYTPVVARGYGLNPVAPDAARGISPLLMPVSQESDLVGLSPLLLSDIDDSSEPHGTDQFPVPTPGGPSLYARWTPTAALLDLPEAQAAYLRAAARPPTSQKKKPRPEQTPQPPNFPPLPPELGTPPPQEESTQKPPAPTSPETSPPADEVPSGLPDGYPERIWRTIKAAEEFIREHGFAAYLWVAKQYEDIRYNEPEKTFETYLRERKILLPEIPELVGRLLCGRTGGEEEPEENVARRTSPGRYPAGFGPGDLDKSSKSYGAIRGREQQCIDATRELGISANKINGISPWNPMKPYYIHRSKQEFGETFEHPLFERYKRARLFRRAQMGQGG